MKKVWLKIILLAVFLAFVALLLNPNWPFSLVGSGYCNPEGFCTLMARFNYINLIPNFLLRFAVFLPIVWFLEKKRLLTLRNILFGFLALTIAFLLYILWLTRSGREGSLDLEVQKSARSIATQEGTANWKTYSNPEIKLTLQYPPDWSLEKQTVKTGDESQTVSFKGKEGFFVISWGSGFGGGCPEGYEDINLKRESIKVCHGIDTDGNENWAGFSKILKNTSFTGQATAYKPSETNREVILKIISTMEFSK